MIRTVLVLALVAIAAAQIPARCYSPPQWEGKTEKK
jgi:hypothetical protein